jgi:hypothetical protein
VANAADHEAIRESIRDALARRPDSLPAPTHEYRLVDQAGRPQGAYGAVGPFTVGRVLKFPRGQGTWRVVRIEETTEPARFIDGLPHAVAVIARVDEDVAPA